VTRRTWCSPHAAEGVGGVAIITLGCCTEVKNGFVWQKKTLEKGERGMDRIAAGGCVGSSCRAILQEMIPRTWVLVNVRRQNIAAHLGCPSLPA